MAAASRQEDEAIAEDPQFQELVARRSGFAWVLSLIMLIIYLGFILLIAFAPQLLGTPIGDRVTTIGIPIGLLVIISAFVLTGIYVNRANSEFDALTAKIVAKVKR
jgi:uncharacterized membrane protein (DUF485 family)